MAQDTVWDVVVIGGGPAGMMTAGRARERGRSVLLLEKNAGLGKKLLITGGGRCNVTNNKPDVRTMLERYKNDGKFLFSTFSQYAVPDAISFFMERGVSLKEENEGRLFPVSNTARSVWEVLVNYVKEYGVVVRSRSVVTKVVKDPTAGDFVITLTGGEEVRAHSCVIATGGTSHPETGSTGDGFRWLKTLGHTVIENNYALVPIALADTWVKRVSGITIPDSKLTIYADGKKGKAHKGKMLFTHFGISGPVVLNMSREVGDILAHSEVVLLLDLFPALDPAALRTKFQTPLTTESNKKLKNVLTKLIPVGLVEVILTREGIDGETPTHSVRSGDRTKIVTRMKAIPLHVTSLLGPDKAVISAGGVAPTEVNFKTMESLRVPGLYLAGDILNIDRPSGGYSLQLCWSTGYVAGTNA